MYSGWIIAAALLIAAYCFIVYIRRVLGCRQGETAPGLSLVFLVKNQQDIIEGLIRMVYASACCQTAEVIAVDLGSVDQTCQILQRLTGNFPNLRFLAAGQESGISKKAYRLCHGSTIYCFDLSGSINYNLMYRTIHSILSGSRASLYRTRVLYKNRTWGRCSRNRNVLK